MIVYVDDLYDVSLMKDEGCAILAVDPEAEKLERFRLKKFNIEARMKDVFFQKLLLFRKLLNELTLL